MNALPVEWGFCAPPLCPEGEIASTSQLHEQKLLLFTQWYPKASTPLLLRHANMGHVTLKQASMVIE